MKRHAIKKVDVTTLIVNRNLNFRQDYDVTSLLEEIKLAGRVLEPIQVLLDGSGGYDPNTVLKGNRRTLACQTLLADKSISKELYDAIKAIDVIYLEGLDDKEITEIVLDHGSQKPLSREETLLGVWRLQKAMYSSLDIVILMYHMLARFTGNTQKAYEVTSLPAGPARNEFLKKWLHGTLDNYILAAGRLGAFVREQVQLTERAADRPLTAEEKARVKFTAKVGRIHNLTSAKKKDQENGQWNDEKCSGPIFDAKIEEFIKLDKGDITPPERAPSKQMMEDAATMAKSQIGIVYRRCAGTLPMEKRPDLDALDTELFRLEEMKKALRIVVDRVNVGAKFGGGEVRELMNLFLSGNAVDAEKYFERFITKEPSQMKANTSKKDEPALAGSAKS